VPGRLKVRLEAFLNGLPTPVERELMQYQGKACGHERFKTNTIHQRRESSVLRKLHHVGIIVEDMDHTIRKFEGFGLKCTQVVEKKDGSSKLAFLPVGDTLVEFVSYNPDWKPDPLNSLVQKQPGTINHLCFEVDDIDAAIRDFERNGVKLVEGTPLSVEMGRIAFFYPETTEGILIEICQL
jgi:methylmalonyl-CoA/ethylmalonyl-CoA epimerase